MLTKLKYVGVSTADLLDIYILYVWPAGILFSSVELHFDRKKRPEH
jgi:hypothetical protein